MLKKCKYLLSCLLIGLGFIAFSNAGSYTITGSSSANATSINNYSVLIGLPVYGYSPYKNLGRVSIVCDVTNPVNVDLGYVLKACPGSTTVANYSTTCNQMSAPSTSQISDGIIFEGQYNGPAYAIQIVFSNSSNPGTFSFDWSCTLSGANIGVDCPECQECQSCPEVDTNYCVENDLCPVASNFSQLYINNIEHESQPIINIGIPDYITWDYSVGSGIFDVYVGSGYDVDYINSIIDINSYRPDSTDFTNVFVSGLTLIMPYIIFVLFLVFMRKLIKRIFK